MEDFTPPENLEVKAMANGRTHFVKEEKYLNYVDIKSRFIGLLFRYKKNQYLYRYPDGFEGIEGESLELLEKRSIDSQIDDGLNIRENEIHVVEIIETIDGYIFCSLFRNLCSNIQFMISKNFQLVAINLYDMVEDMRWRNEEFENLFFGAQ